MVNGQGVESGTGQELFVVSLASLSSAVLQQIDRACDHAEETRSGSVIVIQLEGSGQSAIERVDTQLLTQWERGLRRLERVPAVTIAAAGADCGWLELSALLTADFRIVTGDVRFRLSGPLGVLPGMAIHRLANQIGIARSRRMVLFDGELTAKAAAGIGLVDEVVDDLSAHVDAFVGYAKNVDVTDLAVRRQLLLEAPSRSFEDALGAHLAACDRLLRRSRRVS